MGLHTDTEIHKTAYDLLGVVVEAARNMPRDVKQQLGQELRGECVQITVLIFRANVARNKAPHLLEVLERLQVAELLLRLAHDLRFIGQKQYAAAIALTGQIGKQANGWRKHSASPAA